MTAVEIETSRAADAAAIAQLREDFSKEGRNVAYVCAGQIPVAAADQSDRSTSKSAVLGRQHERADVCKPVAIRWDRDDGTGTALSLPVVDHAAALKLEALVKGCCPATFGRGGEDAYDEGYRRAGAMSPERFCTNFCPYESGVIDIVTQLLLPPIVGDLPEEMPESPFESLRKTYDKEHKLNVISDVLEEETLALPFSQMGLGIPQLQSILTRFEVPARNADEMALIVDRVDPDYTGIMDHRAVAEVILQRTAEKEVRANIAEEAMRQKGMRRQRWLNLGVRAQLYKLNVYSGPSGRFRPHVDTPRAESQFGSLVVCLPVHFEGGALAVRHQGQEVVHNWADAASTPTGSCIQWAAFYSDCEHEVFDVTAGHRITLTYNLHVAPGTGMLNAQMTSLMPRKLGLYTRLRAMLANPTLMVRGGYVGSRLIHKYPHAHPRLHTYVPSMLKGADMVLYEAVAALGLVSVLVPFQKWNINPVGLLEHLDRLHLGRRSAAHHGQATAQITSSSLLAALKINENVYEDTIDVDAIMDQVCGSTSGCVCHTDDTSGKDS